MIFWDICNPNMLLLNPWFEQQHKLSFFSFIDDVVCIVTETVYSNMRPKLGIDELRALFNMIQVNRSTDTKRLFSDNTKFDFPNFCHGAWYLDDITIAAEGQAVYKSSREAGLISTWTPILCAQRCDTKVEKHTTREMLRVMEQRRKGSTTRSNQAV